MAAVKEALPGVLSSARGFVEGELLPEAANMQAAYDKMQAERRAEAERQAAAMALWEAAGKRRAPRCGASLSAMVLLTWVHM